MTDLKALEKVREHITWIIDQYAEQCMTTFPIPTRAAEAKAILDQLIEREKHPADLQAARTMLELHEAMETVSIERLWADLLNCVLRLERSCS